MLRIAFTVLLVLAWHFPTTFFVPAGPPYERGWIVWPFGQQTRPALETLGGVVAPAALPSTGSLTLALLAAAIASLAFIVAIGAVWGIVVPAAWLQPAVVAGAVASLALFLIYLSPLAAIPIAIDVVLLWGVLAQGWSAAQLTEP